MANYKVPQDVEADDKLIGPFSFRQFVYLIIVAMAGALAWGLYKIFPPLFIIPLPIIILFGALALPLRKDQPMEIFLAAMIVFYLKPRRRLWEPDGIDSLIEVIAPKIVDFQLTKNLSTNEAEKRLSYLAEIVDSRGWAVRSPIGYQATNSAMNSDAFYEAQQAKDILDVDSFAVQQIDNKLTQSSNKHHQDVLNLMKTTAVPVPPPPPAPVQTDQLTTQLPAQNTIPVQNKPAELQYNPYPEDIHQLIVQPLSVKDQITTEQPKTPANIVSSTSNKAVSADIINLASNKDLSVETIAHEANRISKKQEVNNEVVISLR